MNVGPIKMFFRYERMYSVTSMLLELALPSFNTFLYNFQFLFNMQWKSCSSSIIVYLKRLGINGLTV